MINLYDYPDLYFSLFEPSLSVQNWVEKNLHHYFPDGVDLFLEPACGPGFWINKIKSNYFLGVDINSNAIRWAQQNIEKTNGEFVVGNMKELEKYTNAKFDLVLNLESTIGHLNSLADVYIHLKSVRNIISDKGYYFLGVPLINDYFQDKINSISYKTNPVKLKTYGYGFLEMSSSFKHNNKNTLRLSYKIKVIGNSNYQDEILCNLDLISYDAMEMTKIIKDSRFEICEVNYVQFPDNPTSKSLYNLGIVSLILKPI